jgi:hypothetical protein
MGRKRRMRAGRSPRPSPSAFEGAQFFVRILEKGAHLRRNLRHFPRCALSTIVRIFEPRAHLRSRASALTSASSVEPHPVPFSRKVVQALASALIALVSTDHCHPPRRFGPWFSAYTFLDFVRHPQGKGRSADYADVADLNSQKSASSAKSADLSFSPARGAYSELTRPANKKSRAWTLIRARLRIGEIDSF